MSDEQFEHEVDEVVCWLKSSLYQGDEKNCVVKETPKGLWSLLPESVGVIADGNFETRRPGEEMAEEQITMKREEALRFMLNMQNNLPLITRHKEVKDERVWRFQLQRWPWNGHT